MELPRSSGLHSVYGVRNTTVMQGTCRRDLLFHLTKINGRSSAKDVRGHHADNVADIISRELNCEITSVVITNHSSEAH